MASDKRVVQIFRRAVNKAKNVNRLVRQGSNVEGFFASKGAAYAIPDGDFARKATLKGGELQAHLQEMANLLRDEDTMRLVVKIESEPQYTRYLCVVTTCGLSDEQESVILGFDWIEDEVTLGLVIPLWNNVSTKLDGDGGFEVKTEYRHYVFKPVSVQTLWTALLWVHKCLNVAHRAKHFDGGLSHAWLDYYQSKISSPRECIFYWESVDELENKREVSFSHFDEVKTDEELLKGSIRNKLKEVLTRFDLEEVTCRQIREALETEMKMSLQHLKEYIDEQLFVILGQMESSTKITEYLYLGSEWNACNLQELKDNDVHYILNITKEVDNFFPGTFEYMNIRIYDVKEADLLRHWGKTYRFIHKAKERGASTLVHCRRGISRSASTVIAYLMKENAMSLADAMKFVKSKRNIVQPNSGFWKQLIIYEGILKSSRHRHNSIFRKRSNSDASKFRRPHSKAKLKKDIDDVDNTPEHAHTLPKMRNQNMTVESVQCTEENSAETETVDSVSSSEDISSNSDEDLSCIERLKIRRTVSEPVMAHPDEAMTISPTRKSRAKTFVEQEAADMSSSTSQIFEDLEYDKPLEMSFATKVYDVVENDVSSNINSEEMKDLSKVDTSHDSTLTIDDASNVCHLPQVAEPLQKVSNPCFSTQDSNETCESSQSTCQHPSRSITEKLKDKGVGSSASSDKAIDLKVSKTRGRVKRRERRSKSDLQLCDSGFVKRHTQIIEEQMLYSLLKNSDKTLATLANDFWETTLNGKKTFEESQHWSNHLKAQGNERNPFSQNISQTQLEGKISDKRHEISYDDSGNLPEATEHSVTIVKTVMDNEKTSVQSDSDMGHFLWTTRKLQCRWIVTGEQFLWTTRKLQCRLIVTWEQFLWTTRKLQCRRIVTWEQFLWTTRKL
ncbi:protein phosphatase Slingshot homolog isoform X2 [Xenia sp. Carnegie-2017]|uniref:protein phosphatase Slingshot homolog isoform X2 n=1 Tax=Xenia sp. Carnegie-2017 TaxID=2897299 RepID=UPI001F03865E|nr:protein phosphatase Slingshot homolog isoform X2 [Xenia sp. Carnegie-2017]